MLAEFVETIVVVPISCVKEDKEVCNKSYENYGEGNTLRFASENTME